MLIEIRDVGGWFSPDERLYVNNRDRSKLLALDRDDGTIAHRRFDALTELLGPGDLLGEYGLFDEGARSATVSPVSSATSFRSVI